MVGRFVEQEQVGLLHEQAREMGAHDPAAAHGPGRAIEIRFPKREARKNALRFGFHIPVSVFVESSVRGQLSVFRGSRAGSVRYFAASQFQNGFFARGRMFLREKSNRR